ncbi:MULTISPECIES: hypothetical protein [Streptomyces]|uniref:hypothetical protein n=1 Tax=Streptomyces TaxID=1883 RepID=UPI00117F4B66|nr:MULTISPECIES: hypothetical protein [Streptomyces]
MEPDAPAATLDGQSRHGTGIPGSQSSTTSPSPLGRIEANARSANFAIALRAPGGANALISERISASSVSIESMPRSSLQPGILQAAIAVLTNMP